MRRKPDTYEQSRLAILSTIVQRCTSKSYGGKLYPAYAGFINEQNPVAGDLVRIESCGPSKWYLSWYVTTTGPSSYVLESIEDHSTCRWSNVGLSVFDRNEIQPQWRWTDKQWAFWKRWQVPDRSDRPYFVLPCMPEFEGDSVTLKTRGRFGLDHRAIKSKTFDNWRKVTKKDMQEFYYSVVKECSTPAT